MYKSIDTTVFSNGQGGGNPCLVTLFADELSTKEMQKMTFDYTFEAAFVLKSEDKDCDFKVRYFTPKNEMGMCVHATIACASLLVLEKLTDKNPIFFETMLGKIEIEWKEENGEIIVSPYQFLPKYKDVNPSREECAKALNIREKEIDTLPIEQVSTSRYKLIIPLKSKDVLYNLKPDFAYLKSLCDKYDVSGLYPFTKVGDDYYARQFPQNSGYPEDPVTGVAASALSAYAVKNMPHKEGWNEITVYQGEAMGRPGIIGARCFVENGKVTKTQVIGKAEVLNN